MAVNEIEKQVVDGVAQNGWYAVAYAPSAGDPEELFTYTVGLTKTAGWPEMIVFGLDAERATGILRDTMGSCWEGGIRPDGGVELTQVLQGLPVRLKRVDELSAPYFTIADWYAEQSGTPILAERVQIMWPDRDGRFPDDPDCDPDIRERQTPKVGG